MVLTIHPNRDVIMIEVISNQDLNRIQTHSLRFSATLLSPVALLSECLYSA